jgi:hypothetical protein
MSERVSSFHCGVAAEAFAAGQFALFGYDVSVQYGANQPEYDLLIVRGDRTLKISVKGSQDGSWGLTQGLLKDADYHGAIDRWLKRHGARTALCLVQFKDVIPGGLPRMYLATAPEVATRLKATAAGRGDTILYERKVWGSRARGSGTTDEVPSTWQLTRERVAALLET